MTGKGYLVPQPDGRILMHVKGNAPGHRFAMTCDWFDNPICNLMEKDPDNRPLNAAGGEEPIDAEGGGANERGQIMLNAGGLHHHRETRRN